MVLFYSGHLMPGGALYASLVDAGLAILFVISFARLPADAPA
jgi:multisubunit Na+/H+ antiporter MnhB subunit